MTPDGLLRELVAARARREPCVLVTVASVRGSVPRQPGSKALIFEDGRILGSIGGGKLEALVIADAQATLQDASPVLKTYPLHEASPDSFGAICGGEVTLFFEPQALGESLHIFGAGHCGQALADLAMNCGWHVTLVDDRTELLQSARANVLHEGPASGYISSRPWQKNDAIVLVARNYLLDLDALAVTLASPGAGYVGMMGSRRKVRSVFDELRHQGVSDASLSQVHAPVGLDIQADSPMEIAVSILAEIMTVMRQRSGGSLRS
jgi:xanthine dehydrogenase accessory factor